MKRLLLFVAFALIAGAQMRAPDAEQFVGPPLTGAALETQTHVLAWCSSPASQS